MLPAHQLATVTAMADTLAAEKRSVFLDRVAARLRVPGRRFTDAELEKVVRQALQGLSQPPRSLDAAIPGLVVASAYPPEARARRSRSALSRLFAKLSCTRGPLFSRTVFFDVILG
jgi:hypothetical protein